MRGREPLASFSAGLFAIALVIGLLVGLVAYENIKHQSPVYQSSAVMLIDQPVQIATGNEGTVAKLTLLRLKYLALLGTTEVVGPAAREAGVSDAELVGSERPTAPIQSLTILPAIRSKNPVLAQRMAQALANSLADYVVTEQEALKLPPQAQIVVRVINNARVGGKVSPTKERARQAGLIVGAGGLLVAYAVLQLIRSRQT